MNDIATDDMKTFPGSINPKDQLAHKKAIDAQEKANKVPNNKKMDKAIKEVNKQQGQRVKTKEASAKEIALIKRKIQLYYEKLGHKLSSKAPRKLPNNLEELLDIKEGIETELNCNGGIEGAKAAYLGGVNAVEQLAPLLPWDIRVQGTTRVLQQNPSAWEDLICQCSIEYAEYFMMSPFKRLLMFTVVTMSSVHQANSAMGVAPNYQPSEDLSKEAEDL